MSARYKPNILCKLRQFVQPQPCLCWPMRKVSFPANWKYDSPSAKMSPPVYTETRQINNTQNFVTQVSDAPYLKDLTHSVDSILNNDL
ncbi:hypothetical protein RSOLAG1IB_09597 [Rhizoctonia solani AG-1 IB]|uniref:Uncharacterized protein n=1 Tax=Thanatephorus cucumeris (strain AG1-IB / isolate 7/3/14) TaxID=1108050 RepID=A0A0B7FU27_THACB|nr:hypothetical protein RSOLAG1IB_09597 [Rhizoctonia solani AG-1 IB]